MSRDLNKINSIYTQLPDVLKAIYSSDKTIDFQLDMLTKYRINDVKRDAYLDLTYDTMLGLSPFSQLRQKLVSENIVPELEADACVRDIKNYIQPLLDYWSAGQKEPVATDNQTEEISSVPPIRTMEGDLKRVHGYGSFSDLYGDNNTRDTVYKSEQGTVMKKGGLAETPTYNTEPKAES